MNESLKPFREPSALIGVVSSYQPIKKLLPTNQKRLPYDSDTQTTVAKKLVQTAQRNQNSAHRTWWSLTIFAPVFLTPHRRPRHLAWKPDQDFIHKSRVNQALDLTWPLPPFENRPGL